MLNIFNDVIRSSFRKFFGPRTLYELTKKTTMWQDPKMTGSARLKVRLKAKVDAKYLPFALTSRFFIDPHSQKFPKFTFQPRPSRVKISQFNCNPETRKQHFDKSTSISIFDLYLI